MLLCYTVAGGTITSSLERCPGCQIEGVRLRRTTPEPTRVRGDVITHAPSPLWTVNCCGTPGFNMWAEQKRRLLPDFGSVFWGTSPYRPRAVGSKLREAFLTGAQKEEHESLHILSCGKLASSIIYIYIFIFYFLWINCEQMHTWKRLSARGWSLFAAVVYFYYKCYISVP